MQREIEYYFDQIFENFYKTSRDSNFYISLDQKLKKDIADSNFAPNMSGTENFGPFGALNFQYREMGAINSLDLFGLDELLLFAFYWANKNNYKNVSDIGANIGLHSILMSKCNWNVNAYEPDPNTIKCLEENVKSNNLANIKVNQMAVSGYSGTAEFTRVLGNTTGSHLSGAKDNPYGDLEKFSVKVKDIKDIMPYTDFIKLDVEGEEANVVTSTNSEDWDNCHMVLEVGSDSNAEAIYNHLLSLNVNMFSQKNNWDIADSLSDIPISYKQGSLFVSKKDSLPMQKI